MQEESKGLLAVWADVDADYHLEFEKWHNCEHMADRMTIPGFQVGYRYQGIGASPYSLMAYETSDSSVLESEPYLKSKNTPSRWTREALSHYKNTERMIYNLLASEGQRPITQAPCILVWRFDSEPEGAPGGVEKLGEKFLSKIIAIPGVLRARLYKVNEGISNIVTQEQNIYGKKEAPPRGFLVFIEMASLNVPETRAWRDGYARISGDCKALGIMKDIGEELYWLRFVMHEPKGPRKNNFTL